MLVAATASVFWLQYIPNIPPTGPVLATSAPPCTPTGSAFQSIITAHYCTRVACCPATCCCSHRVLVSVQQCICREKTPCPQNPHALHQQSTSAHPLPLLSTASLLHTIAHCRTLLHTCGMLPSMNKPLLSSTCAACAASLASCACSSDSSIVTHGAAVLSTAGLGRTRTAAATNPSSFLRTVTALLA